MKECSKCNVVKPLSGFDKKTKSPDGRQGYCRTCSQKENREYVERYPEKRRNRHLKYEYGVTNEEFDFFLHKQRGVCAICQNPEPKAHKRLSVDHDHESGNVRGLLCSRCNVGIGYLKDSETILMAAVAYLKNIKTQPETQSPMIKKINRFLRIFGLNLVHAKKAKRAGYRSHVPIEDARTNAKCIPSPTCCVDEYNAGRTHYVGDGCKPAHNDASPTQDNNTPV